jgi:hypothetical protein
VSSGMRPVWHVGFGSHSIRNSVSKLSRSYAVLKRECNMKLAKCPECGKLISTRFPVHQCKPERKPRQKTAAARPPLKREGLG